LKKIISIFLLLLVYSGLNAMQDTSTVISEFSAKLKKNNIYLNWSLKKINDISKIRMEVKNPGDGIFQYLEEINSENYLQKIKNDSTEYYNYSYSYKPYKEGVYFFRIKIIDKNYHIINSEEIKIGVSDVSEFKLHQNSPNPFNPTTSITYELYSPTKVILKIYSLNGKEIETLVEDYQSPGTYKIDFNAAKYAELSSGIYFYKLQADHSSDIKKMIFTK
jgi:hypothetical protein